jgi:hypothetical protein
LSIDAAISNEVLRVLKPLGIEAALKAIEAQSSTTTAAERQLELSLQQPVEPLGPESFQAQLRACSAACDCAMSPL